MNTQIQTLKTENQNLNLLLQDKKRKKKARQIKFSFKQSLNFQAWDYEKIQYQIHRKLKKKSNSNKKIQTEIDKMEVEQKMKTQQKLYFKPLIKSSYYFQKTGDLWSQCLQRKIMLEQHRKQFGTSRRLYCNCFGGFYRKKLVVVDSNVTILKQNLDNQQQQNKQLQKDNNDLRIYLEKMKKNYKKMEEQFYEFNEKKEQLSQFQIGSEEDMYF